MSASTRTPTADIGTTTIRTKKVVNRERKLMTRIAALTVSAAFKRSKSLRRLKPRAPAADREAGDVADYTLPHTARPSAAARGYSSVWESAWIAPRRSPVRARLAPFRSKSCRGERFGPRQRVEVVANQRRGWAAWARRHNLDADHVSAQPVTANSSRPPRHCRSGDRARPAAEPRRRSLRNRFRNRPGARPSCPSRAGG
jgi:hypothetical protein